MTVTDDPARTIVVRREGAVRSVQIAAPPMNLLGPELVHDLRHGPPSPGSPSTSDEGVG